MKEKYENPEVEIVSIDEADIIFASGCGDNPECTYNTPGNPW